MVPANCCSKLSADPAAGGVKYAGDDWNGVEGDETPGIGIGKELIGIKAVLGLPGAEATVSTSNLPTTGLPRRALVFAKPLVARSTGNRPKPPII
jgi:hypothetical protein